jgi:hypothetical protein
MNAVYYVRREEANGQITIESVEYGSITHWNIKDLGKLKIYEPCMGERRFIGKTGTDGQESYVEWLQIMRKKYQ